MLDSDLNCTREHCVDGWCKNISISCACLKTEDHRCIEHTDLTYTSYIIAAILSFTGSLMILGCVIASIHYAKYAYRYWCVSCHQPISKKSGSILSIASYFKTPNRISRLQPHLVSRSRTSLQHNTVIIAHPTTQRHPMTVLYGQCIESTRVDKPPPYSIVVPGRLSRERRSNISLDQSRTSVIGWDDFKRSLQSVAGFERQRKTGWDRNAVQGMQESRGLFHGLQSRMRSLGSLIEDRGPSASAPAWDDHRRSTSSIDVERPPAKNPDHESFLSLCEIHPPSRRSMLTSMDRHTIDTGIEIDRDFDVENPNETEVEMHDTMIMDEEV